VPWSRDLDRSAPAILCVGENHHASARAFAAEHVFAHYGIDRLVLEASPQQARTIAAGADGGETNPTLLGADISGLIAAARERNPELAITGLEGSAEAWGEARAVGVEQGRDQRLAKRFWRNYEPGRRHVLLYGGLHCSNWSLWLFHYLQTTAPDHVEADMRSVRLHAADQDPSMHAFVHFAHTLGVVTNDFVVTDTAALAEEVGHWFPLLNQSVLAAFDTLVVYGVDAVLRGQRVVSEPPATARRDGAFPHWSAGGVTRKPDTGAQRDAPRWYKPESNRRPSTGDIDLTGGHDRFPHPTPAAPARKPSTGDAMTTPPREGDFPHITR